VYASVSVFVSVFLCQCCLRAKVRKCLSALAFTLTHTSDSLQVQVLENEVLSLSKAMKSMIPSSAASAKKQPLQVAHDYILSVIGVYLLSETSCTVNRF